MNKLLNLEWKKVVKGALIAGAGAALTYATEYLGEVDFGAAEVLVAAALSTLVNFINKFAQAGKE